MDNRPSFTPAERDWFFGEFGTITIKTFSPDAMGTLARIQTFGAKVAELTAEPEPKHPGPEMPPPGAAHGVKEDNNESEEDLK